MRSFSYAAIVIGLLGMSSVASAQDATNTDPAVDPAATPDTGAMEAPPPDTAATTADEPTSVSDEQALHEETAVVEVSRDSSDPYEDPHTSYHFAGILYRHAVVPTFIQHLFADGGVTVSDPGLGGEYTYRKDGFSITGSLWWQNWSFVNPFRTNGDADTNTEIINSSWYTINMAASFMWSTQFNDMLALEYGVDVGLGIVGGTGTRSEAYPSSGAGSVGGYAACSRANDPNEHPTPGVYCAPNPGGGESAQDGQHGEHYNVTAQKWSGGGSVPNIIPWLGLPHIALRFKPVHQLQMRLDLGFFGGFFFGAGVQYGF